MEKYITDLDLPESKRTQANFWKMRYLEMFKEVQSANKGIRRLKCKLVRLQKLTNHSTGH